MKKLLSLLALIIVTLTINAATYTINDIPNVHLKDKYQFVSDPDGYMSTDAKREVNHHLRSLMDSTSAEVAIVLVE